MTLSLVLLATSFSDVRILSESDGAAGCPCLSSSSTTLPNNNQVVLAGKTYFVPAAGSAAKLSQSPSNGQQAAGSNTTKDEASFGERLARLEAFIMGTPGTSAPWTAPSWTPPWGASAAHDPMTA